MKSENLIHVKLEYPEAVQSKRDILETQRDLLRILKTLKKFHLIRIEELKFKAKLAKKIKELKSNISKLHQVLPKVQVPEILHHEEKEKTELKIKEDYHDTDLESQLEEIQNRLRSLS